jgi:hypothetical protein
LRLSNLSGQLNQLDLRSILVKARTKVDAEAE